MARHGQTFHTLNGMRGIAAIAVAMMHFQWFLAGLHPAIVSLAVDFFFVLSGFVIAFAYEKRLQSGLRRRDFLLARFIRLYPMFLAGMLLGILAVTLYQPPQDMTAFWGNVALNSFMLPYPFEFPAVNDDLFPLNFPAWSLFFELVAYTLFACLMPRLGNRTLLILIAAGFLALIVIGVTQGTLDRGVWRPSWPGGLARVTFCFFAGVGLYRLWLRKPTRFALHPAMMLAVLATPLLWRPHPELDNAWLYELAVLTVWMPLMVWLGAGSHASGASQRACAFLGTISYPLYIVHAPLVLIAINFNNRQGDAFFMANAPWAGFAFIGVLIALAWLLATFVDLPVRRFLVKNLLADRLRVSAKAESAKDGDPASAP
ncbi:acyltransferase family protein [Aurantiacibacter sp. MUD61]|uniref:acyltransferase family protein n=1 Tax=Aurantiacibacter sp. MUD61 TaxID=3009083 RepID=UPI0022F0BC7D|nr:acyltransferase [Aurantiacibacter sp. MUD61]